jgi:Raf kinase inhibitor-like YbhB/YbcL family protein
MPLLMTSPALPPGGEIQKQYTCDGSDISPPLAWSNVPKGTQSFALVVEDPDAPGGTFRHWAAYNIPATTIGLPAGFHAGAPAPFAQARNDFGKIGYSGPCPPPGSRHRYVFTLMALGVSALAIPPSPEARAVISAALPCMVGRAELVSSYQR